MMILKKVFFPSFCVWVGIHLFYIYYIPLWKHCFASISLTYKLVLSSASMVNHVASDFSSPVRHYWLEMAFASLGLDWVYVFFFSESVYVCVSVPFHRSHTRIFSPFSCWPVMQFFSRWINYLVILAVSSLSFHLLLVSYDLNKK